jgi:hypothetical protein
MNEDADPIRPEQSPEESSPVESIPPEPPKRTFGYWARRLLACNPFYLVSAALLLYGCYEISTDPEVQRQNLLHLFLNFGSIQVYELLLVATAIFLARRRIWYDSTLLFGLENLLLSVPFILISQGALVGQQLREKHFTWELCLTAGILAALRMGGLKRFMGNLNFPRRSVAVGMAFLAANVALPATYRALHEGKVGTHVEAGAAYYTNEFAWLLLLPGLCALALAVPAMVHQGEPWPERGWLPAGMFGLWLTGTAVHLYCLGYIYDFDLRGELVAPALWILVWMIQRRATDLKLKPVRETVLLIPPLLATLVAISPAGDKVFLSLTLLNAVLYAILCFARGNQVALHLLVISLAALVGGFPEEWGRKIFAEFNRAECLWGAAAAYGLFWTMWSRNPASGVFGGLIAGLITGGTVASGNRLGVAHWAIQAGLVVLLMHSLRWEDRYHSGAAWLRALACGMWVAHTCFWMRMGGSFWMASCTAIPLILVYFAGRFLIGEWGPRILPLAVLLVILSGPADTGAVRLRTFSTGVLAMIGSFVLFAIGTVAAMTKHRWHRE